MKLFEEITKSEMKVPIVLGDINHGPAGPGSSMMK